AGGAGAGGRADARFATHFCAKSRAPACITALGSKWEDAMVKRREVVAGIAVLPIVSLGLGPVWAQQAALEGDAIPTADGDIIVHPVDHASLVLGFGDQVIYCDPV